MKSARLWQATRASSVTPAMAVMCLLTIAVAAELIARAGLFDRELAPPSWGTQARMFDLQMQRVYALHRSSGLDCAFLGSSPAHDGLDPAAFSEGFAAVTGRRRPTCFNASVPGMRAASASAVGRVLLEDLNPWLVVYGYSPRDLTLEAHGPLLTNSEWLRYRAGDFSLRGLLIDQSIAFRLFVGNDTAFQQREGRKLRDATILRRDGFFQRPGLLENPDQVLEKIRARSPLGKARHDPLAIQSLAALLDHPAARGRVVVVQMPVHDSIRPWLAELSFYEKSIRSVAQLTAEHGVPFLQADADVVPESGWADPVHTNTVGAVPLSKWLAARVADEVHAGRLRGPEKAP